jgi:two-component system chemotaxis response regulator CheB
VPGPIVTAPYRVLVADDSPSARRLISSILGDDPGLSVVAEAEDGEQAVRLAAQLHPDVITMDVHMPRLDGIGAIRRIMAETPRPVVVISAYSESDVNLSFEALDAGAVTILAKPPGPAAPNFAERAAEITRTVKGMADLKVVTRKWRPDQPVRHTPPHAGDGARRLGTTPIGLVAIAASTGGPQASPVPRSWRRVGGNLT